MRLYEILNESKFKFGTDKHYQFHMSVEPSLVNGKNFSQQKRTISIDGAGGDALGEGNRIYTTLNLQYWATQFFYEDVEDFPAYVYLVYVDSPSDGSIHAAHQDANLPHDVTVLALLDKINVENDEVPDYGRIIWLAEKLISKSM